MALKDIICKISKYRDGKTMKIADRIEIFREELIELGMEKGFQDPAVIKKSQQLDKLINQYYNVKVSTRGKVAV